MNKKQLGITIILICLMGVLFVGQSIFNDKFQAISLMNNNISDFKEYTDSKNQIVFKLPSQWETSEQNYPGNYIISQKNFSDSTVGIVGFLQVVNYPGDINALINKDKGYIEGSMENYTKEEYSSKNYKGVKVSYISMAKDSKESFNDVYYFKINNGEVVKLGFNAKEDYYKTSYQDIYKTLADSIK